MTAIIDLWLIGVAAGVVALIIAMVWHFAKAAPHPEGEHQMTTDLAALWRERQDLSRELLEHGDDWDQEKFNAESDRLNALDDQILAAEARTVGEVALQLRALLGSFDSGGRDDVAPLGRIADQLDWLVEGQRFGSPSGATKVATTKAGAPANLDGWLYWRVRRPGTSRWRRLKDLRNGRAA